MLIRMLGCGNSTLLRLVRHYKSLEIEAHFHLAQCLLQLDPELRCFSDEIAMCLDKVCSSSTKSPAFDESVEDAAAWNQMKRESTVRVFACLLLWVLNTNQCLGSIIYDRSCWRMCSWHRATWSAQRTSTGN